MFCIFVFIFDAKRLYIICNFSETCSAAYKEMLSINKIKLHKKSQFQEIYNLHEQKLFKENEHKVIKV